MNKHIPYVIVRKTDIIDLISEVNYYIKKGFIPVGGVVLDNIEHLYYQTLFKK